MGGSEDDKNVVCKIIKSKNFAKTIDDLYFPYLGMQNGINEVKSQLKRFNSHCSTHYPNAAVLLIHPIGTYQFDIGDLLNNNITKAFWADYDILETVYNQIGVINCHR